MFFWKLGQRWSLDLGFGTNFNLNMNLKRMGRIKLFETNF